MNNRGLVASIAVGRPARAVAMESEWLPGPEQIVIGKDVLELLSTSMYVDPMTIYREYVQNSADAVDEARAANLISPKDPGRVTISIDPTGRSIRIRDNGTGLACGQFVS